MAVASVKGATQNLIRTSVPNLISGVSQQADSLKLTTQAIQQTNALSNVAKGLTKRPPTKWIKELNSTFSGFTPLKYFFIESESTENFLGVVLNNNSTNSKSIKIFDLAGNEKSVINYDGSETYLTSYLSGLNTETLGNKNIDVLTIADYSILTNKSKIVALTNDLSPRALTNTTLANSYQVYQGIILVKTGYTGYSGQSPSGQISWSGKITQNGTTYSVSGNSDEWNTGGLGGVPATLASSIATKFNAVLSSTAIRVHLVGTNVYFQSVSDFDLEVNDGYGGTLFYPIVKEVQNFTDLPTQAHHNFVTKVAGMPDSAGDEYYVAHKSSILNTWLTGGGATPSVAGNQGSADKPNLYAVGDGVWEESIKPGEKYKFDYSTLPHAIVKLSSTTFLVTPLNGVTATYNLSGGGTKSYTAPDWREREVGDFESNPVPSFVGKAINNIFFFKNRLGILSGESISLSEAGEFFNFYRTTMAQLLDSDPIDVTSSTRKVGTLFHSIPFYDRLVLFADGIQFSLQSDGELTTKSVSLQHTTSFDVDVSNPPVAIGSKIYFSYSKAPYSGVQEYFINPNTILLDGEDITSHLPSYFDGQITQFTGSDANNILMCLYSGKPNEIGVYNYFYANEEKLQSSWSKFDFGTGSNIKFIFFNKNKLYIVINRGGYLSFESVDFNLESKDAVANSSFNVLLDKKTTGYTIARHITNADGKFVELTLSNYNVPVFASNAWVASSATYPTFSASGTDGTTGLRWNPANYLMVHLNGKSYQAYYCFFNADSNIAVTGDAVKTFQPNKILLSLGLSSVADLSGNNQHYLGVPYKMDYKISRPIIKSTAGRGQSAVVDGRFQIKNGVLLYDKSRFFQVKVTPKYRDTYTYSYVYNFISDYLGTGSTNLDYIHMEDGAFTFPVFCKSTDIEVLFENTSPYPSNFLSLEWEALYSARSKRIG